MAIKVYTNIQSLNMPKDAIECESFTVISIECLLVYRNKYYLQIYLDNCTHKIVNKKMTNHLDKNLIEDQIL